MKITSRDNSLLRRARLIRDGKDAQMIFVEGLRLCEEALRSGLKIEAVLYSEELAAKTRAARVIGEIEKVAVRSASIGEELLKSISYTKTPQGIVVLATRPVFTAEAFRKTQPASPLLVVLHGINNPVNVGAIVRTAEAAGCTGVITTAGTSDPYSPKALRGAMGSAFRLAIWNRADFKAVLEWCRKRGVQTIGADAGGTKVYTEIDWRRPSALVVGHESKGLSTAEVKAADVSVRIPMQGSIESLNVGVAAGILLYEAARQRHPVQ